MREATGSNTASSIDSTAPPVVLSEDEQRVGTAVRPHGTGERAGTSQKAETSDISKLPIITTLPKYILRHSISDEELVMLSSSQTSSLENFMWACFGVASGGLVSAIRDLKAAYYDEPSIPLDVIQMTEVIFFFVSAAAFLLLFSICKRSNKDQKALVQRIRDRGEQRR
jgi:hypothetical protein